MAEEPNAEKKIIIDDDWKTQAQSEKARLSEEVEKKPCGPAAAAGPRDIPPASFEALIGTIATQAMMALGGMVDRRTGRPVVDLDLAKFHIDTLSVLETKTRGNLTDDEKEQLDEAIYQLRMQFVQVAQAAEPTPGGSPVPGVADPENPRPSF